jgi:exonuclease III
MPEALFRDKLVALHSSPLSSLRLPADAYYVISSLGIASRRTQRGCRSGKSARRARAAKRFLPVGLINANSANNKVPLIAHFILSNNLDILVITETKFSVADGPDDARALCPEGFSSIQVSRNSVHRGGGVAVLYRDAIVATDKRQCVPHTCPITYEYMSLALTVNSVAVRLVVVYRPPKSSVSCFIQEFSDYLELLSASTGKLLIMGDFNIHVDRPDLPVVAKFYLR